MTLRNSGSAVPEGSVAAIELPALAEALLVAGQLARYGELFAQLASIEDPHRRYQATVKLLELGLAAGARTPPARTPVLFGVMAAGVLEALERAPSEPRLLGYAGAILAELSSFDAAEALLEAARRLDPRLADVDRGLARLAARRREATVAAGPARRPAIAELGGLAARARELASRAGPAEGLRLSLCMIVRDEQEMLPRCLSAAAAAVDEIVIVDTGSSDATVEIARSFGARVIEHPWRGSFAEARNVSFDAAEGDWLVYLDADEVLVEGDCALLRSLTGRTWREGFYLCETNHTGELGDGTAVVHNALRVLRNRREYRFHGRVHEQIAGSLPTYLPERLEVSGVRVEHFGYLGSVRSARAKSARNIELLRAEQAERPPSAFLHFNLGSEHAAAGNSLAAMAELKRAWELLDDGIDRAGEEFVAPLASRLVRALRDCGRAEDAIARAEEALEWLPGFTDLVYEQALARLELGQRERALALFRRCVEMGEPPRRYAPRVGTGTHLPRLCLAEILCEEGDVGEAIELLEAVLAEQPQSSRARVALGEVLLSQRRYAEAAEVLAELGGSDPLALRASRTELCARIAGGDGAGAGAALERARAAGMPAAELELMLAWQQISSNGHGSISIAREAVERLAHTLETLLRVQDFAAFEAMLGLLELAPLSARERRELIAGMYLRRGFLASAADEWMAVCREQPDSRALLGLARVALARGMEREATEFADAAHARDPADEEAARLLAELQPATAASTAGLGRVERSQTNDGSRIGIEGIPR